MKRIAVIILSMALMLPAWPNVFAQEQGTTAVQADAEDVQPEEYSALYNGGSNIMWISMAGAGLASSTYLLYMTQIIDLNLIEYFFGAMFILPLTGLGALAMSTGLAGLPMLAAGAAIKDAGPNWRKAVFNGPCQSRFTIMPQYSLGVSYFCHSLTVGWHLNQHWFAGAGAGIGMNYYENAVWRSKSKPRDRNYPMTAPLYGDIRFSVLDGTFTPFLGIAPGYDLSSNYWYFSAEAGLRIRLKSDSPRSAWCSVQLIRGYSENYKALPASGDYYWSIGYKLAWSL